MKKKNSFEVEVLPLKSGVDVKQGQRCLET